MQKAGGRRAAPLERDRRRCQKMKGKPSRSDGRLKRCEVCSYWGQLMHYKNYKVSPTVCHTFLTLHVFVRLLPCPNAHANHRKLNQFNLITGS